MGKSLDVFRNRCLSLQSFRVKNAKNDFLKKMATNGSTRLEKHQTIEILLGVDFYAFLKILLFFEIFPVFEMH